jgi:prolyl oligopeptidase PreP (S9A serine peptidase family)
MQAAFWLAFVAAVVQVFVTSKDGVQVPMFITHR